MVITASKSRRRAAMLTTELVIAMAVLVLAVIPLGYSFWRDQQACRVYYRHALAMEIVDGEMEVLLAGEWRAFPEGSQPYPVHAGSATNLGNGEFILTRSNHWLRLEWRPSRLAQGGKVMREGVGQ